MTSQLQLCQAPRARLAPAHCARQVRARFVERFETGTSFAGGEVTGPSTQDVQEKVSWVEKFMRVGGGVADAAKSEHDRCATCHCSGPAQACSAGLFAEV